jgi:hypothetical protein
MFEADLETCNCCTAVWHRKRGCVMVCKIAREAKMKKSVRPYVKSLSSGVATLAATTHHQHRRDRPSPASERSTCVTERKTVPRAKVSHISQEKADSLSESMSCSNLLIGCPNHHFHVRVRSCPFSGIQKQQFSQFQSVLKMLH